LRGAAGAADSASGERKLTASAGSLERFCGAAGELDCGVVAAGGGAIVVRGGGFACGDATYGDVSVNAAALVGALGIGAEGGGLYGAGAVPNEGGGGALGMLPVTGRAGAFGCMGCTGVKPVVDAGVAGKLLAGPGGGGAEIPDGRATPLPGGGGGAGIPGV
jgi:hypothetical protein